MGFPERLRRIGAVAVCALPVATGVAAEALDPLELATRLAAGGERVAGGEGHVRAVRLLREAMQSAGLQQVAVTAGGSSDGVRLEGELPGSSGLEILLTAHLDTVPGTPGAADDAAGCAVVLAAASRLAVLPRRHGLRVILFDGEEDGRAGSREWVEALPAPRRAAVLAALNVDQVGRGSGAAGVVLSLPVEAGGRWRVAPGWVVSAVARASRSIERPLGVGAATMGPLVQVLTRAFAVGLESDAQSLVAAGIPAVTLTERDLFRPDPGIHTASDRAEHLGGPALDGWVDRVSASVRRLDALAGRPRDDDRYLAVVGRVWSRRDLYWVGLVLWGAWIFRSLPRRRGAVSARQTTLVRQHDPLGLLARFLYLASLLVSPVLTLTLLGPACALLLLPARLVPAVRWRLLVATAPLLTVLATVVYLVGAGVVTGPAIGWAPAGLLLATWASLLRLLAGSPGGPPQALRESSPSVLTAKAHSSSEL